MTSCAQTQLPLPLRSQVLLSDPHTQAALDLARHTVLLGLARNDVPVVLPDDTANVLVCAGAGAGTTTALRTLAAQAVRLGAHVDILDLHPAARGEHEWAAPVEGVNLYLHVEDIHDRLLELAGSLAHRDRTPAWTRRSVVVVEDMPVILASLRQHWRHTRPESQLDEPPVVTALLHLLTGGSARGVQVWAGNPGAVLPGISAEVRRLFPQRLIGNASHTVWRRAAFEVWPIPSCNSAPGRFHLVAERTATALQVLRLDHSQARAFAAGPGGDR